MRDANTGVPHAKDSAMTIGNPSYHSEGTMRNSAFETASSTADRFCTPVNSMLRSELSAPSSAAKHRRR